MNLHEYYRNHKDAINASIMDIACDLAVGRLLNAHGAPFETFVEADDPDDPDGGTHYKEEYQKEYDTYYDKEYARVAKLMKFDYCQEVQSIKVHSSIVSVQNPSFPEPAAPYGHHIYIYSSYNLSYRLHTVQ